MSETAAQQSPPRVAVLADVASNATALIEHVLNPAGIVAWPAEEKGLPPDLYLVDITQLRGDPLTALRNLRANGSDAPAIILAAHFPASRLRELLQVGANDILLKPYRPEDLCQAIRELSQARARGQSTQSLARKTEALEKQLARRSEEIRLLSDIGRIVVSLRELNEILCKVAEAAAYVTEAEEANIYLAEPGTKELVLRASKQAGERHATLQRLRVQDTLVGQVFQTGQPVLRQPPLEGGTVKVQTGFLVRSLIKDPLRLGRSRVRGLGVYNRLAERSFDNHQVVLLQALADWAGVALEHASLANQAGLESQAASSVRAIHPDLLQGLKQVKGHLQLLVGGAYGPVFPAQKKALQQLDGELATLSSMPVALLRAEEAKQLIDLPALIRRVCEDLQLEAARQGLKLSLDTEDSMPLFRGDLPSLRRVLEDLTFSAIHRTVSGHVTLSARQFLVKDNRTDDLVVPDHVRLGDGPWAAVAVADTSTGLPAEAIQALRQKDLDPLAGKSGPGLSLGEVRMIVESMGGAIWHHTQEMGASITFAMPFS